MYIRNYKLGKTLLDKCLKSSALQYLLRRNMVKAPEHSSNLNEGNFTRSIDYCEGN